MPIGEIIQAVGSYAGGLRAARATEQANAANIAAQREFAQHGIRWRVEDAKAAGLHPLYALGGSVTPFAPSVVPATQAGEGLAQAGQSLGRAVQAVQTKEEKLATQLRLEGMAIANRKDDAIRAYYDSEAARNLARTLTGPSLPLGDTGTVLTEPATSVSRAREDASRTASVQPMWQRHEVLPGIPLDVMRSEEGPAEGLEGAGPLMLALLRNLYLYGRGFGRQVRKYQKRILDYKPERSE